MNQRTLFKSIIYTAICGVFLVCLASFTSKDNGAKAYSNTDYSYSEDKIILNNNEVLPQLINDPSEVELLQIEDYPNQISYSKNPNLNVFKTAVLDGKTYIFVKKYEETGNNGRHVEWIPSTLTYKTENYKFSYENDYYTVAIDNYDENDTNANITYTLNLSLDKDIANEMINFAYNLGKQLSEERISAIEEYDADVLTYQNYLNDLEAYNQNVSDWANYEAALEVYENNQIAWESYNISHNAYLVNKALWDKYELDLEARRRYEIEKAYYDANWEQNLEDYNNFYPNFRKFEHRLNAMNLIYAHMKPMNRSIYDAVMGDSVTTVLNRKADLVALGVDSKIIDNAAIATDNLRTVFVAYKNCTTDANKYAYYRQNYSFIKGNVEDLLRYLDKLYRSPIVPTAIASQGPDKVGKYKFLVAQLAYLANAIDDKDVYNYEGWNGYIGSLKNNGAKIIDQEWTFAGLTYEQYLEGEEFLDVSGDELKSYPLEATYPSEVVELLVEPTFVPVPTEPSEIINDVVAPPTINEPVPPESEIDRPDIVEEPNISNYYSFNRREVLLADSYDSGTLINHDDFTNDQIIRVEDSCAIDISKNRSKLCRFIGENGVVEGNSLFEDHPIYSGKTPFKEQDYQFNDYLFIGWVDENNEPVDLNEINETTTVFANFQGRNLEKFDITYIVGEQIYKYTCPVGEMPMTPSDLSIDDTEDAYFVFNGWDKEIVPVHKAETYTARFVEKQKIVITWDIEGILTTEKYKEGEIIRYKGTTPTKQEDDDRYYVFFGWDKLEGIGASEDLTYKAIFEAKEYITVTWNYEGGSISEKHKKESSYQNPNIPSYFDDCYIYVLDSFVRSSSSTENHIIFDAEYEKQYIINNKDNTGIHTSVENSQIIIDLSKDNTNSIKLATLFDLFGDGYEVNEIKIVGKEYIISISKTQVNLLRTLNVDVFEFDCSGTSDISFKINLLNKNGQTINNSNLNFSLVLNKDFDSFRSKVFSGESPVTADIYGNELRMYISPNRQYVCEKTYNIRPVITEGVTYSIKSNNGRKGESITIDYEVQNGYELNYFQVLFKDGTSILTNGTFEMRDFDADIIPNTTKILYKIEYFVDDRVVTVSYKYYGSLLTPPSDPFKYPTKDTKYVFIGWAEEIKPVTGNAQYHAVFEEKPITINPIPDKISWISVVEYSLLGVGITGLLVFLAYILKKKVLKK